MSLIRRSLFQIFAQPFRTYIPPEKRRPKGRPKRWEVEKFGVEKQVLEERRRGRETRMSIVEEAKKPDIQSLEKCADDSPIQAQNPYAGEKEQCILCKFQIRLNYKNPRLLSQFISSFTGRLYQKHITGLCEFQQQKLHQTIRMARKAGYMPVFQKEPKFLRDPRLFDPMNPQRPNPF